MGQAGMSVHVTARFRAAAGKADALVPLLVRLAEGSRTESGCLRYDYLQNGDLFTSVEEWATPEAERAHNDTDALRAMLRDILPLLDGRPEVTRWTRIT